MARKSGFHSIGLCLLAAASCTSSPHPVPTPNPSPSGVLTVAYPYEPSTLDVRARGGTSPATSDLLGFLGGAARPVGAPFTLRAWHKGLDMFFQANLRATTMPSFAMIRVVFVPDPAGALELLKRSEVDVLGPYLAPDWQRRLRAAGAQLSSATGTSWVGLSFSRAVDAGTRARVVGSFDLPRIVQGLVQAEGKAYPGGGLTSEAVGPKTKLTLAVPEPDDLSGAVARAIQFQARATLDIQPIAVDATELYDSWFASEHSQVAITLSRSAPSVDLVRSRSSVPLFEPAVTLAWRAGRVCGVRIEDAGAPFARSGEWRRC